MSRLADEIEREIHKRFAEQVYVGMSPNDHFAALTHVVVRYVAEYLAGDKSCECGLTGEGRCPVCMTIPREKRAEKV